jgi:hypothetical protein
MRLALVGGITFPKGERHLYLTGWKASDFEGWHAVWAHNDWWMHRTTFLDCWHIRLGSQWLVEGCLTFLEKGRRTGILLPGRLLINRVGIGPGLSVTDECLTLLEERPLIKEASMRTGLSMAGGC